MISLVSRACFVLFKFLWSEYLIYLRVESGHALSIVVVLSPYVSHEPLTSLTKIQDTCVFFPVSGDFSLEGLLLVRCGALYLKSLNQRETIPK